ncbi:MAG: T9SS type A sorting domain-containing protein [Fibrobacteres bacterium]|nr:T9SS type A sorting domain-containing protein [Fibrobacterota bacterium]
MRNGLLISVFAVSIFTSISFSAQPYYPLDSNTVAYWNFDTNSTNINDWSRNNLDGKLYNTVHEDSSAKFTRTAESKGRFPSLDQYIETCNFTIQTRVKIDHKPRPDASYPISTILGYYSFNATSEFGYELKVHVIDNKCYLSASLGEASKTGNTLLSTIPIDTNVWYDLALQYDKKFFTIFVNGEINAQMPYAKNIMLLDSGLYVGTRKPGTPDFFLDGHIKEITVSKIARLPYVNKILENDVNTVGLWRFNSLVNNTALDESIYKNDGRVVGNVVCTTSDARTYYKLRTNNANIAINNIRQFSENLNFKFEAITRSSSFDVNTSRPIIYMRDTSTFDSLAISLAFCQNYERVFAFTTWGKLGSVSPLFAPIPIGLENQWFKIGAEYINGVRKIFLNDSCIAKDSITPIQRFPGGYSTNIGNDNFQSPSINHSNWFFNSDIDELKISSYRYNQLPLIKSLPDTIALENHLYTYPVETFDPDTDKVSLSLVTAPTGMILRNDTIIFTPTIEQVGRPTVTIKATDSKGGFALQTYTLRILPRSGQVSIVDSTPKNDSIYINEADSLIFSISAKSRNSSAIITYQWYKNEQFIASDSFYKFKTNYRSAGSCSLKVVAFDGIEFVEKKWNVTVKNVALKPLLISPTTDNPVTGDSLFKWTCPDPDLLPATTRYDFQLMKNSQPDVPVLELFALSESEFRLNSKFTRTQLTPNTIYRCRIRAYSGQDTTPYSDPKVFFYSDYGMAAERQNKVRNICYASPNPFNPVTAVTIEDDKMFSNALVTITDISGRLVNSFNVSKKTPIVSFAWNGRDYMNNLCHTGHYVLNIKSDNYNKTLKVILSK